MVKKFSNFEIECVGEIDCYVYDIEVEDTHTFFANDILVHNSNYVDMSALVNAVMPNETDEQKITTFLDNVGKSAIEPVLEKAFEELRVMTNCKKSKMVMEREVIASDAIWVGKKRYTMRVLDNEGVRYDKPKFKIMGLESVKSSTPEYCRKALEDCYTISLTGTNKDLIARVKEFDKQFKSMSIEDISFPRSANNFAKWRDAGTIYKSGTPIAVKGSLIYNKMIDERDLSKVHNKIKDGEKIKYIILKNKNPTTDKVISFVNYLPEELGLHRYIDYKTMYEKSFLDPLISYINHIGWTHKEVNKLSFG